MRSVARRAARPTTRDVQVRKALVAQSPMAGTDSYINSPP